MGLADLIKQGPPPKKNRCAVGTIIDSLDPDDADALNDAIEKLASGTAHFSAAWLHRVLLSEGHKIAENTFSKHVNQRCTCATQ